MNMNHLEGVTYISWKKNISCVGIIKTQRVNTDHSNKKHMLTLRLERKERSHNLHRSLLNLLFFLISSLYDFVCVCVCYWYCRDLLIYMWYGCRRPESVTPVYLIYEPHIFWSKNCSICEDNRILPNPNFLMMVCVYEYMQKCMRIINLILFWMNECLLNENRQLVKGGGLWLTELYEDNPENESDTAGHRLIAKACSIYKLPRSTCLPQRYQELNRCQCAVDSWGNLGR